MCASLCESECVRVCECAPVCECVPVTCAVKATCQGLRVLILVPILHPFGCSLAISISTFNSISIPIPACQLHVAFGFLAMPLQQFTADKLLFLYPATIKILEHRVFTYSNCEVEIFAQKELRDGERKRERERDREERY